MGLETRPIRLRIRIWLRSLGGSLGDLLDSLARIRTRGLIRIRGGSDPGSLVVCSLEDSDYSLGELKESKDGGERDGSKRSRRL